MTPPPAAEGGLDSLELVELDQSGNVVHPEGIPMLGGYRGRHAALNVPNPQPDTRYYWGNRQDQGAIIEALNAGWRPVRDEDPEYQLDPYEGHLTDNRAGSRTDTTRSHRELLLLKMPESHYQALQQELKQTGQRMMDNAGGDFVGMASAEERRLGSGRPTRYDLADHGIDVREGPGIWEE